MSTNPSIERQLKTLLTPLLSTSESTDRAINPKPLSLIVRKHAINKIDKISKESKVKHAVRLLSVIIPIVDAYKDYRP